MLSCWRELTVKAGEQRNSVGWNGSLDFNKQNYDWILPLAANSRSLTADVYHHNFSIIFHAQHAQVMGNVKWQDQKKKWDCEQERKKGELIRVQRKLGGSSNRNQLVNASYLCHWNFSHEGQWPTPICIKAACAIQPNVKWEPHSFIAWITQPKISPISCWIVPGNE